LLAEILVLGFGPHPKPFRERRLQPAMVQGSNQHATDTSVKKDPKSGTLNPSAEGCWDSQARPNLRGVPNYILRAAQQMAVCQGVTIKDPDPSIKRIKIGSA